MTHFYKRILVLALLATATSPVSASYKNMLMVASATVATGITTNYLYNYLCKYADRRAVTNGVRIHQEAKGRAQTLQSTYAYELDVLAQHAGDMQNPAIFNNLYEKIRSLYTSKSCYYYAINAQRTITLLKNALYACQLAHDDLAQRTQSVPKNSWHSCQEQESLVTQYVQIIKDINHLEIQLKQLILDVFMIRSHVMSSTQYAFEYQKARIEELERLNRLSHYNYYKPYYTTTYVNVTCPKITPAPKTVTYTVTTTPRVEPVTFDAHIWCDRTDPFNS